MPEANSDIRAAVYDFTAMALPASTRLAVTENKKANEHSLAFLFCMVRPERFELPTPKFVARCSIQLSYGRVKQKRNCAESTLFRSIGTILILAESEGFEPSMEAFDPILP